MACIGLSMASRTTLRAAFLILIAALSSLLACSSSLGCFASLRQISWDSSSAAAWETRRP